jgi:mRNA interferase HigB
LGKWFETELGLDIKGNRYRIVAQIKYAPLCLVYIRFIGTHAEYAKLDARSI